MKFLQLIRYKNLLIIIVTQLVIRYGLLQPMLQSNYNFMGMTLELQLAFWQFALLVLATVFLSASGYIINDYFDVNADMLNKPDKVVIGKSISLRTAMALHWVFNILGIVCGTIVSYSIGHVNFAMIFIFISGLLWFYSTSFSKEPFLGNLIIAFLVAFVPLIEALYELLPLNFYYKNIMTAMYLNFEELLFWSLGYSLFAFLLTLVREMVKDIEDLEGDSAYGRNTLPIAFGVKTAKIVTASVFAITIGALMLIQIAYLRDIFSVIYLYIALLIPLVVGMWLFIKADSALQYHKVSVLLKIVMLIGLVYIILVNLVL